MGDTIPVIGQGLRVMCEVASNAPYGPPQWLDPQGDAVMSIAPGTHCMNVYRFLVYSTRTTLSYILLKILITLFFKESDDH